MARRRKRCYLSYFWRSPPKPLPTPRIARGSGYWVPNCREAVSRRLGEKQGWEAVYCFWASITTKAEIEALKTLPQEEW